MTIKILIAASLLAATTHAITIPIDPGPQGRVRGDETISFAALDGLALSGQTISLDYTFTGDKFLRMLPETSKSFIFLVILDTNATGFLPWPTGSGFLTDANGNDIGGDFAGGGSSSGQPGEQLDAGFALFPLLLNGGSDVLPVTDHFDFSGAHFDLTFPDVQGSQILDARLLLLTNANHPWNDVWVIGPHMPDSGATLSLFALGVLATLALRSRVRV
jgi:hypothetical protein